MSRGASSSSSMDAICLDEWELPPDHESFFCVEECAGNEHGGVGGKGHLLLGAKLVRVDMDHFPAASHRTPRYGFDEKAAEKPFLSPSEDVHANVPVTECKDIGIVKTESKREETIPKATEISDAEEEEATIKCPHRVEEGVDQDNEAVVETAPPDHHHHRFAAGEDEGVKIFGFSFGDLRGHGVGAMCSFGVAAATFCVLLLGGKQQQGNRQNHKIRLQMYADNDQRIQRVMQKASRLNQTMSSVNGGGGASPSAPASISFGGHYRGF